MTCTLFTHHGHLLLYLDAHPDALLRDAATALGVTERTAHKVIAELTEAGYVSSDRVGRRKHYTVHHEAPVREGQLARRTLGQLLAG